jgi:putative multiple sugar transport system substrate-binding protein
VAQTIKEIQALQKGEDPEINDTESYDNGVKVVPSFLLTPVIVTKENAADVYKDDDTLAPLTQG